MNGLSFFSLATVFLAGVVRGEMFDCVNYEHTKVCTLDLVPFCLTNSTIVSGRCDAQRAVCLEKATIDETFSACSKQSHSNFDCDQFNPMVCARDAIPFCLTNGTILRGSCFAKRAVCLDKQTVDDDFSSCNQASLRDNNMDDGNTATSLSATLSLLVSLLFSTLL
ncbi:uncharacterized protein [Littorina saxatilis]|uniref:Uncharacterized protein n=1 Tax=Littorina saxatilis TaxID=31220 RepID=A0AAN9GHX5_9CAEN